VEATAAPKDRTERRDRESLICDCSWLRACECDIAHLRIARRQTTGNCFDAQVRLLIRQHIAAKCSSYFEKSWHAQKFY
jgi:hypothetical protein